MIGLGRWDGGQRKRIRLAAQGWYCPWRHRAASRAGSPAQPGQVRSQQRCELAPCPPRRPGLRLPAGLQYAPHHPALTCWCRVSADPTGSGPGPSCQGARPRGRPPSSQCSSPSCPTPGDGAGSSHIFSPTALCILKTIYAHRRSFSAGGCQSLFLFCPSGLSAAGRLSLPILQKRRLRLRAGGGWHCS